MTDMADVKVNFEAPNPGFAERVRESFGRQAFMAHIGAVLDSVAAGAVEIALPYRAALCQQHGFFHGGVIGTLADNACGYAGFTLAPADSSVLTVEYKLNLLSPAAGETLVARGRVLRPGRTLVVAQADVFTRRDDGAKHVATALATLMLMAGMADTPHSPDDRPLKPTAMDSSP